jgi:hypothetical protein
MMFSHSFENLIKCHEIKNIQIEVLGQQLLISIKNGKAYYQYVPKQIFWIYVCWISRWLCESL